MPAPAPTCLTCNYALTGVAAPRCPECGRDFDPANPTTFGPREPLLPRALARCAPPLWFQLVLACSLTLVVIFASSPNGAMADGVSIVPLVVFFVVAPAWLLAFTLHFVTRRVMQHKQEPLPPRRWTWIITPLLILTYASLWRTGAVFWLRWHFAKDDVLALQQQLTFPRAAAGNIIFGLPTWIGTFRVTGYMIFADGTIQLQLGRSDAYSDGPARLEWGPSAPTGSPMHAELSDGWWLCWDHT